MLNDMLIRVAPGELLDSLRDNLLALRTGLERVNSLLEQRFITKFTVHLYLLLLNFQNGQRNPI
jgi:hypothetical protein